jgi:tetratricopeptide (TPR) repeat protein
MGEAEFVAGMASGAVERMGNPPLLKAFLEDRIGVLDLRMERYDNAIAHLRAALALWEKHLGPESIGAAESLTNIGVAFATKGDLPQAVEYEAKAIGALKNAVGDSHPMLARVYNNLGSDYHDMGQQNKAAEMVRAAIAIYDRSQSSKPRSVALAYSNLGKILVEQGSMREAREAFERQVRICLKAYGPNSSEVARTYWDLAVYFHETKDYERAGESLKSALAIFRANGEQARSVGGVLRDLGVLRVTQRRYAEAQSLLDEALKLLAPALGKNNPELANPLRMLGEAQLGLHRPREAAHSLQSALDLHPERAFGPLELAQVRFDLAKALWESNQERAKAVAIAKEAHDELARAEHSHANDVVLVKIQAWLGQRPQRATLVGR